MSTTLKAHFQGSDLKLEISTSRLDASTARELREELAMIWRPHPGEVTVDLSQVEFIDSSGMGSLLSIHRRLPEKHTPVRLVNVRPAVQSVLELVRLHRVFDLT
jgi:anti-sigma B factor antagonist